MTRFAARRLGRWALSGAALLVLSLGTSDANAAVRSPPDPRVAAEVFVEACREGLRDANRFDGVVRSPELGFALIELAGTTSRYSGRRDVPMAIEMTPGVSCVARLRFFEPADVERFVEEVSRLTELLVGVRVSTGAEPSIRDYSWPDQTVNGGRVIMRGTAVDPDRRPRLEPQGIQLTFSASFVPGDAQASTTHED